jgi:two-component system response regulator AtoC
MQRRQCFGDTSARNRRNWCRVPSNATEMSANATNQRGDSLLAASLPPEDVLFGRSAAMSSVRQRAERVAVTDVPVLIEGDGGTGKELLARWIHSHSAVGSGPFIKLNCAAIPETLLESELFGFEKGAFTGALQRKPGHVELAHGGTLFLDEIAEIRPNLQAKLLQFLQDGRFSRIGEDEEQRVEARVICATSRNLEQEIMAGSFRADLYYRINVIRIRMPRLRERREDVLLLAVYFLSHFNARFERSAPIFPDALAENLRSWHWPGNIRELENRIARYVILGPDDFQEKKPEANRATSVATVPVTEASIPLKRITKLAVRDMERSLILNVLQANHWNRRKTAEALKISYRALIYKIREAGITGERQRPSSAAHTTPSGVTSRPNGD